MTTQEPPLPVLGTESYMIIHVKLPRYELAKVPLGNTPDTYLDPVIEYFESLGLKPRHPDSIIQTWDDPDAAFVHYRQVLPLPWSEICES